VKLSASGVTQHGFALNVAADLRYFGQIVPCGIVGRGVTSLERLLGAAPPHAEVEWRVAEAFGKVFGVDTGSCQSLSPSGTLLLSDQTQQEVPDGHGPG
jgi:lipoate-protein ligase B